MSFILDDGTSYNLDRAAADQKRHALEQLVERTKLGYNFTSDRTFTYALLRSDEDTGLARELNISVLSRWNETRAATYDEHIPEEWPSMPAEWTSRREPGDGLNNEYLPP